MVVKNSISYINNILEERGYYLKTGQTYESCKEKMIVLDHEGYKYFISIDSFFNNITHKCKSLYKFSTRNKFTIENMNLWLKKSNKTFSLVSAEFTKTINRDLIFCCHICNNEWNSSWNGVMSNRGCPLCALKTSGEKRRISIDEVIKMFEENLIEIIDPSSYTITEEKVFSKCKKCGYEWFTDYHHVRNGRACPVCKMSRGEKKIKKYLDSQEIFYEPQKRFPDCKYKKMLPFDFYLPDYETCIEYNGIQHYEEVDYFGGESHLNKVKIRDDIKKKYCDINGINLLKISYIDFNHVEEILLDSVSSSKITATSKIIKEKN
jgi:hypothetical protein